MNQTDATTTPLHERFSYYFILYAVPFVLPCLIWHLSLLYVWSWFGVALPVLGGAFHKKSSKATRLSCLGLSAALTFATIASIIRDVLT
ncbi:MAG: hypothetical protein O2857_27135 [Planctomycetota bacterium]|nr:hypothetical protein [Planctomycetota bacterium]